MIDGPSKSSNSAVSERLNVAICYRISHIEPMQRIQTLSSGLMLRQDLAESVRPIFFQTAIEEFQYATHGGTLFLVQHEGRIFGFTCKHVFQDFDHASLFVAREKYPQKGSQPARVTSFFFPTAPRDGAVGSDLLDICLVEFAPESSPDFFGGTAYVIDDKTIATSEKGDKLLVSGVLKEPSAITPENIEIGYCSLEYSDIGTLTSDPTLRSAETEFTAPAFSEVTGISGSPWPDGLFVPGS